MTRSLLALALTLCASTSSWADPALAQARNCMACHTVDKKIVGPAFKAIASKYAADNASITPQLASKIRHGGRGVWGPVPMPANPKVSEAEAQQLAAWILSLH